MCGFAGFIDSTRATGGDALRHGALRMADALHHRGPNDSGVWVDESAGIGFGFRRLSIVDLSPEGHQPMRSATGRYVVLFNGEIYNHAVLRRELAAGESPPAFRGHSDTEVLLAAVERWGVEGSVRRFVGMFAFALWDRKEHRLTLGRDRLGEKPLHYGWMGRTFLFGSELKALRPHPDFRGELDRDAVAAFLRSGYIPAPHSIYKGIYKLPPGTLLALSGTIAQERPAPVPYWSAKEVVEAGQADPFPGTEAEAVGHLDRLLRESVGLQMVADVPLGAFLSGGVDSSAVVALMQAQSPRPVKTFTIGFAEAEYNEANHSRAVAKHLGTDHTELHVTPADALAVIPKLPGIYDEPFADSSQVPTFLVSQLAARSVTVSLSGDGGDELFGGYSWYFQARRIWDIVGRVPKSLRRLAATALGAVSPRLWNRILPLLRPVVSRHVTGDRVHKFATLLRDVNGPDSVYRSLMTRWTGPPPIVHGACEPRTVLTDEASWPRLGGLIDRAMYVDAVTYLPDNTLAKVDRASMAVGLESRAPFLDHRVMEFAWRLPPAMKVRGSRGKWALRQVLYRYVPPALIERPKMGFCVPIDSWLRGPLAEWAHGLLAEKRLREEGVFDPAPVRRKWREHLSGVGNWQHQLWCVLMFQAWLEAEKTGPRPADHGPPRNARAGPPERGVVAS
ncbi:MAG: asnB 1 [Gemmataceae bacterium]|nr:asnB 1 [Gemmataceae bacterium]